LHRNYFYFVKMKLNIFINYKTGDKHLPNKRMRGVYGKRDKCGPLSLSSPKLFEVSYKSNKNGFLTLIKYKPKLE